MDCHHAAPTQTAERRILLVGNPNVGKSVLFGVLTGRYVTVSNYPGTTVEVTEGVAAVNGRRSRVVDTPGVNGLVAMSEDEGVTRDILLAAGERVVVQVADAKNLRRALLISIQLAEAGLPFAIALNMDDEARDRGIHVDAEALGRLLGVPVTATVATHGVGTAALRESIERAAVSRFRVDYGDAIEDVVAEIGECIADAPVSARAIALMLLSGEEMPAPGESNEPAGWLRRAGCAADIERIEEICRRTRGSAGHPPGYVIGRARLAAADAAVARVVRRKPGAEGTPAGTLGRLAMHRWWGVPILLAVLLLTYELVGIFAAGTCVEFLENTVFGAPGDGGLIVPFVEHHVTGLLGRSGVGGFFRDLLVGDYGTITMAIRYAIAIILPIVGFFFLVFGILEDSGYLPRLAVMVNRWFKLIGLNGRAVLPMILGLGCGTMATLTARILPTRKERVLVTLLLALAIPCSAQLGVQAALLAGRGAAPFLIWAGVMVAILFVVGRIASSVIPGAASDFILEIPPIRMPGLGNVARKTLARIEWYLKEAVPLFIGGTLLLFVMDKIVIGRGLTLLGGVVKIGEPVVKGVLGLPPEAAAAFVVGFLRRDYGAVWLYDAARSLAISTNQVLVALVTLTLFIPCVASLLINVKERGFRTAATMVAVIFPLAFLVGGALNFVLNLLEISL